MSPDALDREPEEIEPLVDRNDLGLLAGEPNAERRNDPLALLDERLGALPAARDAQDKIVRVARKAAGRAAASSDGCPLRPISHGVPCAGEVLIQRRERD